MSIAVTTNIITRKLNSLFLYAYILTLFVTHPPALRSTLYPIQESKDIKHLRPTEIMRIFIVGSRAEGYLPAYIYLQLSYLFPTIPFHIYFIGPQSLPPPYTQPFTQHFN